MNMDSDLLEKSSKGWLNLWIKFQEIKSVMNLTSNINEY